MEVFCGSCGVINRTDRIFCLRCRRRLFPTTKFDLTVNDFVYAGDRANLSVIEDIGWIPAALASQRIKGQEIALREFLSKSATRPETLGRLDLCLRRCGDQLGLEVMPEAFVVPSSSLNAAVMGRSEQSAIFMITPVALQVLSDRELRMVVGHELAHIKSRHMLYHTAAESISAGGSLVASFFGAGAITYPLQMSLLAWHRESEVTADRAALLMEGELNVFALMLTKTLLYNGEVGSGVVSHLFRTHPEHERRLSLAREFCNSPEFFRGRDKLRLRAEAAATSLSCCRSCGAASRRLDNYCGSCGKSLR